MSKHDGGPAFPCEAWEEGKTVMQIPGTTDFMPVTTSTKTVYAGMTLRDWFAGQALAGFCSQCASDGEWSWAVPGATEMAYEIADAMIKAREGKE